MDGKQRALHLIIVADRLEKLLSLPHLIITSCPDAVHSNLDNECMNERGKGKKGRYFSILLSLTCSLQMKEREDGERKVREMHAKDQMTGKETVLRFDSPDSGCVCVTSSACKRRSERRGGHNSRR